jgi:hypothetical protein
MFQESMLARIRNTVYRVVNKPVFYSVYRLTGIRLQSEVLYHDFSLMGAVFNIPAPLAKKILPSNKLIPVERAGGVADINLYGLEYRWMDILLPYNEFAICIPVVYKADKEAEELSGYYYIYLPVTTEDSRWGGVENLGLPKFLADISFEDTSKSRSCTLKADGKEIITLKVNKLPTQLQSWEFNNFGIRDRKLVRNMFNVHGQRGISDATGGAQYTLGDHPIAEKLRALEISQVSVQNEYVPQAQAVLSGVIGSPMAL